MAATLKEAVPEGNNTWSEFALEARALGGKKPLVVADMIEDGRLPRESMSAVTAGSPGNSIARGRRSICRGRPTRRSVLNFSVSVMIAAENHPHRPPAHSCTSQRHQRRWDREFESGLLQRRV
jgi:hypothetical protein